MPARRSSCGGVPARRSSCRTSLVLRGGARASLVLRLSARALLVLRMCLPARRSSCGCVPRVARLADVSRASLVLRVSLPRGLGARARAPSPTVFSRRVSANLPTTWSGADTRPATVPFPRCPRALPLARARETRENRRSKGWRGVQGSAPFTTERKNPSLRRRARRRRRSFRRATSTSGFEVAARGVVVGAPRRRHDCGQTHASGTAARC